jgi:hypothetical protein
MDATSSEQPVFEHHQRRHHVRALHVADVDAFDAQRCIGETEVVLNALQCSRSRVEITGTLELVLGQGILRVAMHGLGERPLVATVRHPQLNP